MVPRRQNRKVSPQSHILDIALGIEEIKQSLKYVDEAIHSKRIKDSGYDFNHLHERMEQFCKEVNDSIESLIDMQCTLIDINEKTHSVTRESQEYIDYKSLCEHEVIQMREKISSAFQKIDMLNLHLRTSVVIDNDKLTSIINDFGGVSDDLADGNKKAREHVKNVSAKYRN